VQPSARGALTQMFGGSVNFELVASPPARAQALDH
jgi:hypothetical protein